MARRFFVSHLARTLRFHERLSKNMLTAAAVVVRNRAKRNVRGGFKGGRFVTSNLFNKIEHRVIVAGIGGRNSRAEIGTTVDYGAFWELGHHNTFTRKYEREEWLRPALEKTKGEQQRAAAKAARRTRDRRGRF